MQNTMSIAEEEERLIFHSNNIRNDCCCIALYDNSMLLIRLFDPGSSLFFSFLVAGDHSLHEQSTQLVFV
jgi:hypothetical protein